MFESKKIANMIRLASRMILALLLKNRLSSLSTLRLGWFTDPIILITAKEMKYKTHERGSVAEKYFTIQRMPVKDRQDKKRQDK